LVSHSPHSFCLFQIGGGGKSEAATAYGIEHANEYDIRIWLEPDEFKGARALHALPLVRGGTKRNVASLLKRQRCLLVIDDPSEPFAAEELATLCGEGSHIIVTTRIETLDEYTIPELIQDEAREILDDSVSAPCPTTIFDKISSTVGGHPLSYVLINAAMRTGADWEDNWKLVMAHGPWLMTAEPAAFGKLAGSAYVSAVEIEKFKSKYLTSGLIGRMFGIN
jgi:hypothetical protein